MRMLYVRQQYTMKKITTSEKLDFISRLTTNYSVASDNINVAIWCPFCKHSNRKKLKLVVHLEKGFYHCWLCDSKGSNIPKIVKRYNPSLLEESIRLFKKAKIKARLFEEEQELFEEVNVDIPSGFKLLANAFNTRNPDVRDVFRYCIRRGVNKHKMWHLRLGYSLDQDFRRQLIIPSFNENGNINFYTSRRIDEDTNSPFKYKNSKVAKKNIVFNELYIDWNIPLTIVEGPLDLIKTNDNSTCLLGSSLTPDMKLFRKIVENKTEINLALDRDVYYKSINIASMLYEYDVNVNILDTRVADDVGDMTHDQFQEVLDCGKKFSKEDRLLSKIAMI